MDYDEAGPDLVKRLTAVGLSADRPRLSVAWPVIAQWFAAPVEGLDYGEPDTDLLLFEGVLDLDEPSKYVPDLPAFRLSFTRQMAISDELGDTEFYVRVSLSFSYRPTDALQALVVMRNDQFGVANADWYQAGGSESEWVGLIESTPSFAAAAQSDAFAYTVSL